MLKSLYITTLEPGSGKTLVALDFMEQLSGRLKSVGLFRPVLADGGGPDLIIALMTSLQHLPFPAENLHGVRWKRLSLLAASKYDELYIRILERYDAIESRCDFVLCVGIDYTGVSRALEFDSNVEVALNLGSTLVPIINGKGKDPGVLARAARTLLESLETRKCAVLAVVINRVEPGSREGIASALER